VIVTDQWDNLEGYYKFQKKRQEKQALRDSA